VSMVVHRGQRGAYPEAVPMPMRDSPAFRHDGPAHREVDVHQTRDLANREKRKAKSIGKRKEETDPQLFTLKFRANCQHPPGENKSIPTDPGSAADPP